MSIFKRLFKVGEANANKLIDSLEKPEVMLDQAIRDKEKQIAEVKKSIAMVIANERESKARLERERQQQADYEKKAEQALLAGNEDLAGKALTRAGEHEQKAVTLEPQWQAQRGEVEKLKAEVKRMDEDLAEVRRNKDFIIAQSKMAEVKKDVYRARANMNKNSGDDLLERMRKKAEKAGYEAEAAAELAGESSDDSLDRQLAALDSGVDSSVQDKLAQMKQRLGK